MSRTNLAIAVPGLMQTIEQRVDVVAWERIYGALDARGFATLEDA